ncbi:MAG TPA: polysaccharide deacetylase family protein [Polyangiaceae bacterium]|nr:polysaccharide deacetylase family protein [Polyangiaceae bacterium]
MLLRLSFWAAGTLTLAAACSFEDPKSDDGGSGGGGAGGQTAVGGQTTASGGKASGGTTSKPTGGTSNQGGTTTAAGTSGEAGAGGQAGETSSASGGTSGAEGGAGGEEAGGAPEGGAGGSEPGGGAGAGGDTTEPVVIGSSIYPKPPGEDTVPQPAGTVGGLTVLNWAGFKSAVSYTFDDSNETQIKHYDDLKSLGVRYTFYLQTGKGAFSDPTWARAAQDGHELGNHTVHHLNQADLSLLPMPTDEVDLATKAIETSYGVKVFTMAGPYGASAYEVMAQNRFFINRGASDGMMLASSPGSAFNVACFIPPDGATVDTFNTQVNQTRTASAWKVFLVHGFKDAVVKDWAYLPVDYPVFQDAVNYAKGLGDVWIDSVKNVGAYWLGQRAFNAATKSVSGSSTTWTWQLPAHFPPGNYLRVTVTGGTLKQQNTPLAWNPRGFYEVALDAKSLTLSP